jgi:hypothetical protein
VIVKPGWDFEISSSAALAWKETHLSTGSSARNGAAQLRDAIA